MRNNKKNIEKATILVVSSAVKNNNPEILEAKKIAFRQWEKDTPYFESCLPIEVMAERGSETLRFGPMKPVGLTNPHSTEKPHAVVQLRQDNLAADHFSLVGFQTQLKWAEEERCIPYPSVIGVVPLGTSIASSSCQRSRTGGKHQLPRTGIQDRSV